MSDPLSTSDRPSVALVTGASAGLGAEFCRQLADRCDAIIAVGRRLERLQQLRDELAGRTLVHPLVADLTTEEGKTRCVEALRQQGPVDVLINNAGFGVNGDFDAVSLERQQAMVELHIGATLRLCAAAIPFMRERGGGIVNVSSVGAFLPRGGVAVYCASKAFLNAYSSALQEEVENSGIRVQALCPGYVRTEFQSRPDIRDFDPERIPDDMWLDPADVVRDSLAALDGGGPVVFVPTGVYRGLCADSLQTQRDLLLSAAAPDSAAPATG